MKVGIIFCAYQCEDLLPKSLTPWVQARGARLGGHDYSICAVSVPFEGFPQEAELDNTRTILGAHAHYGRIDHVIVTDKPIKETEARGSALKWLRDEAKVDVIIQWDADEKPTEKDILGIVTFIEANPFVVWFKFSYRNLVFTKSLALKEPFTPPRAHRVRVPGGYVAHSFYADNNIRYVEEAYGEMNGGIKPDSLFPSMTIPEVVANPLHYSWLNDKRSKRKQEYQSLRWAPPIGAGCSFAWDDSRGGLIWNEEYFRLTGQPIPEVISIDNPS